MVESNVDAHSSKNYHSFFNNKFNVSDYCVHDGNVVIVNWVLGKNKVNGKIEYAVKRGNEIPFIVMEEELCTLKRHHECNLEKRGRKHDASITNAEGLQPNSNKKDRKRLRQQRYRQKKNNNLDDIFMISDESNFSTIDDRDSFSPLSFEEFSVNSIVNETNSDKKTAKVNNVSPDKPRLKFKISKKV